MIARLWRGRATPEGAAAYERHFAATVLPHLDALPGFRGAHLLRRQVAGEVEIVAVTFWESLESIRAFSGPDIEAAHVEPEARAVLRRFDAFAGNYGIALSRSPAAIPGEAKPGG